MKKIAVLLNFTVMFICMLFLTGCGIKLDPVKAIENSFPEKVNQLSGQTPSEISVIIDVTGSMKGFANNDLYNFLIALKSALGQKKVTYYMLNENLTKIEQFDLLLKPETYSSNRTDFSQINTKISDSSAVILLSDLQYNGRASYIQRTEDYQNYLAKNYLVKFYGTELYFKGNAYIEGQPCYFDGKRQYYANLIAANPALYDFFDKILKTSEIGKNAISFVHNTAAKIFMDNNKLFSYDNFELYGNYTDENNGRTSEDIIHLKGGNDTLSCSFKITNILFSEWTSLTINDIRAEFYEFADDTTLAGKAATDAKFQLTDLSITDDVLELKIKSLQNITKAGIIRISVFPRILPTWIELYNCENSAPMEKKKNHTIDLINFLTNISGSAGKPFELTHAYIFVE